MVTNFYQLLAIFAIVVTGQSNAKQTALYIQRNNLLPNHTLINCAVGGSSIRDWQKGEIYYNQCLQMVSEAQADGYIVVGQFHFQGERETANQVRAEEYRRLTVAFFNKFRLHVGIVDTPLVFAQLGPQPTDTPRPYWGYVQTMQASIAGDFPQWTMITTSDIAPYCPVEGPHWCGAGYAEIASRVISALFD